MKVINKLNKEFKGNINSISALKNFCFNTSDIKKLEGNDIQWIKSHKDQVLELHRELLSAGDIKSGNAACNLELVGEVYFGDLDLI